MNESTAWQPDWPIGAWGVLKKGRRITVGWRMSLNFWFRPNLTRGQRWHRFRDGGMQIPLEDGDLFKPPHPALKSFIESHPLPDNWISYFTPLAMRMRAIYREEAREADEPLPATGVRALAQRRSGEAHGS